MLSNVKRQKNLRETLIRAKVAPPPTREKRKINGMKKCGKCIICSYVLEGNVKKSEHFTWKINRKVSCTDSNLIYLIECQKETCKKRYVGFTTRQFKDRMCEHLGYVRNKVISESMGEHYNLPGHSKNDMKFTIIEKVKSTDPLYGREREKVYIRKFNTYYGGLNKEP